MKKLTIIPILLLISYFSKAQHTADMIKSPVWDVIGTLKINKVTTDKQVAVFSAQIKSMENKRVTLQGYMIPIEEGIKHKRFLLSTLPVNQCYYCGKNGVPIMIEIEMETPIDFSYKPIEISGIFKLNYKNAAENIPIWLINATQED
ncbi:hypothetical protein C3K47_15155 [Solitalea longa]|uniref:DUF3299 domain-containing protein n=1 Tax=Solitalea longa TaxID=2079460 RepID=A0A2S4ZYG0_9SPHI|nr:hypothetical protein [Solitalea longa]POY35398.1 hypothetical protein C3K47_15155 [Solitalea longa]